MRQCGPPEANRWLALAGLHCSNISLVNFHSYGRRGLAYAPASKPGLYAVGSSEIKVKVEPLCLIPAMASYGKTAITA